MLPVISVIVPVYRAEKYIAGCIESILKQTFTDFELILIDDASPDHSGDICELYAAKDARIYVLHKENGGVSSARNAGLRTARGRYISFIDADDLVSPALLETLLELLESSAADLSVCGFKTIEESDRDIIRLKEPEALPITNCFGAEDAYKRLFSSYDFQMAVWNKLFIREIILKNRLEFNETLTHGEDGLFVAGYLLSCQNICQTRARLYTYVRSQSSVMNRSDREKSFDYRSLSIYNSLNAIKQLPIPYKSARECLDAHTAAISVGLLLQAVRYSRQDRSLLNRLAENLRENRSAFLQSRHYSLKDKCTAFILSLMYKEKSVK